MCKVENLKGEKKNERRWSAEQRGKNVRERKMNEKGKRQMRGK